MKSQIFHKKIKGLISRSAGTEGEYAEISDGLNIKVPVPMNLGADLHVLFTAPDTWNDDDGAWNWFELVSKMDGDAADYERISHGLYSTTSGTRTPITLQAVITVQMVPNSFSPELRYVDVRPRWSVDEGTAYIGELSWTQITVHTIYRDLDEKPFESI